MDSTKEPFIFYLTLDEALPSTFYIFNKTLKDLGYILVPVRIDQLQSLVATTEQDHVVVINSVTDSKEYKLFNDKVRNLLKFVLKSKRLTYMQLSSFSKLNDARNYSLTKNYYFLKYPLNARVLSSKIVRYCDLKSEKSSKWPGGTRAHLKGLAA